MICEQCGTELDVSGYPPGQKGKCPECGAVLVVAEAAAPAPAPAAREKPAAPAAAKPGARMEAGGKSVLLVGLLVLVLGLVAVAAGINYFINRAPATPAPAGLPGETSPLTAEMVPPAVSAPAPPAATPAPPSPKPAATPAPAAAPARTDTPARTTTPAPPPPPAAARTAAPGTPIRVKILNATGRNGLAAEVEKKLETSDPAIHVVSIGSASFATTETVIYDKHNRMELTRRVHQLLGRGRVTDNVEMGRDYDVLVVIGTDYSGN